MHYRTSPPTCKPFVYILGHHFPCAATGYHGDDR